MRPTMEDICMGVAKLISTRSTCSRLQVGCIITNEDMTRVISWGYNGSAKGMSNKCESLLPGQCGHIHSESNALIKADYGIPNKVIFLTHSPCMNCAKLIINAGIVKIYYDKPYRDLNPILFLEKAGLKVINYGIIQKR